MKKDNILFRVDSSSIIGSGHVYRCLALASSLDFRLVNIYFVCSVLEGNLIQFIRNKGYHVYTLNNNIIDEDSDLSECLSLLDGMQFKWTIVDNYILAERWESGIRAISKYVLVIDDLADKKHNCDILINQNLRLDLESKYNKLTPSNCMLRLGTSHVILDSSFDDYNIKNYKKLKPNLIKNVLIYMGGGNSTKQRNNALKAVIEDSSLNIRVIDGYNISRDSLYIFKENVNYFKHVDNMVEMLGWADIVLGACGISAWERCVFGLPSIVCYTAENQIDDAILLGQKLAAINLGCSSNIIEEEWRDAFYKVAENPILVNVMKENAHKLVGNHEKNRYELVELLMNYD